MDRPTCKTCPYWDFEWDPNDDQVIESPCIRLPPVLHTWPTYKQEVEFRGGDVNTNRHGDFDKDRDVSALQGVRPWTSVDDTCGEHPDFPAYIVSLKAE